MIEMDPELYGQYGESQSQRLSRKIKESPFMAAGILGLAGVVGTGIYRYRQGAGAVRPDLYMMKLRVAASGTIFAACIIGVTLQISKELIDVKRKD
jgi:hypothetical protein